MDLYTNPRSNHLPPLSHRAAAPQEDWQAHQALNAELEAFRQDVGHTWLQARGGAPALQLPGSCWHGTFASDLGDGRRGGWHI